MRLAGMYRSNYYWSCIEPHALFKSFGSPKKLSGKNRAGMARSLKMDGTKNVRNDLFIRFSAFVCIIKIIQMYHTNSAFVCIIQKLTQYTIKLRNKKEGSCLRKNKNLPIWKQILY